MQRLHTAKRRAGHQVSARLHTHTAVDQRHDCARFRAEGDARAARPGRPVGPAGEAPWPDDDVRIERTRLRPDAAGGRPRSVRGERGAEGGGAEVGRPD